MKASVSIITYNHEKFIRQALDSVLMQDVDFEYEIVVGEDCSTDRTRDILLEYQDKYPAKFRLLLPTENQGLIRNFVRTYRSCKGEYVATLDGDDYWTSPDKLKWQVDFLDHHRDFSMCFHTVKHFYDEDENKPGFLFPKNPENISGIKDLLVSNFIPTCSVVFRNKIFGEFPDWYYTLGMEDWPLYILIAQHGKIRHLDRVMGAYRMHSGSLWSSKKEIYTYEEDIKFYQCVNAHLKFKYNRMIRKSLAEYYLKLALLHTEEDNISSARKYAVRSFVLHPFDKDITRKIKSISSLYNPAFYRFLKDIKHAVSGNKK